MYTTITTKSKRERRDMNELTELTENTEYDVNVEAKKIEPDISLAQMGADIIHTWADALARKVEQLESQNKKRTEGLQVAVGLLQKTRPYIQSIHDDSEARHDNEGCDATQWEVMQETEHILDGIATLERIFQEALNE